MLLLTRTRLINWHYFSDSTIELGQMSLFAGDNGVGKSTIIDAIQYALVANIRKIRFNQAAVDMKSGRTLESYCRCKIGVESQDYERKESISHVILEFTGGNRTFCSGIMVECLSDGGSPGEMLWVSENTKLEEIAVYKDSRFLKPSEFRQNIKDIGGTVCPTKSDYNSRLTHLLGVHKRNISFNPYLEAVVRSVNFTPLSSVDKFVCNYILDEKLVDINAMKENLVHYREAEREAVKIEERIKQLNVIRELSEDINEIKKQITLQNMLLVRIEVDICGEEIHGLEDSYEKKKLSIDAERRQMVFFGEQIENKDRLLEEYKKALQGNDAHALYGELERQLGVLKNKIEVENGNIEKHDLLKSQLEVLIGRVLDENTDREIELFNNKRDDGKINIHVMDTEIKAITSLISGMKQEEEELKKGIIRYPDSTVTLLKELKERQIEAYIFADLLDVNDESWQNAVEGWLNTQRFNILVYEKDFQKSIDMYNSLSRSVHSVGLPDLVKMKNAEIKPGSLAEVVIANSPLGKRYVAAVLGDVMTAKTDNLRDYKKSITKECMRYSGYTASRISPEIYSKWVIGKKAKEKRKAELANLIDESESLRDVKTQERDALNRELDVIKRGLDTLLEMKTTSSAKERLLVLEKDYSGIKEQLDAIDITEFREQQEWISKLSEEIRILRNEKDAMLRRIGGAEQILEGLEQKITGKKEQENALRKRSEECINSHIELHDEFLAYYNERTKEKNYNEVKIKFERTKRGNETKCENLQNDLLKKKNDFNRENNFYLPAERDDGAPFLELLEKYINTELPQYREKISRARIDAEKQFKEHFVTKLNEYIEEAKESFKEINSSLKSIMFGRDRYMFMIEQKPENKKTLSVIKTAARINENEGTLWERLNDDEDREVVERLFNKILENDIDSAEVKNLCDYREYYQYDIKITHTDISQESLLSKVLKEKSGGETQTPYYVAIAASFYRFFKNEPSAIRLVLFDEAFSKMDDERIGKTIDFFRQMGIQIITAVPTEKIEPIVPYMDKTNIVIRNAKNAYVQDYSVIVKECENAN